jgi:hypothetical protein
LFFVCNKTDLGNDHETTLGYGRYHCPGGLRWTPIVRQPEPSFKV